MSKSMTFGSMTFTAAGLLLLSTLGVSAQSSMAPPVRGGPPMTEPAPVQGRSVQPGTSPSDDTTAPTSTDRSASPAHPEAGSNGNSSAGH